MIISRHFYEPMLPDMRPQDPNMDGSGLTFETLEYGGEEPDTMPQAIKVTDGEGRWCVYVAVTENGQVVRSHGFGLHTEN